MVSEEPIKAVNKPKCKGHPYAILLWILVTGISLPISFMFGTRHPETVARPRPCVNAVNINGKATLVDAADGAILVWNEYTVSDDTWLDRVAEPYVTKLGYRLCPRGVK